MGHVTVVGGCRAKAPSTGILASSLAVGTTVKLMEGGTAVEYLVVNQGFPVIPTCMTQAATERGC